MTLWRRSWVWCGFLARVEVRQIEGAAAALWPFRDVFLNAKNGWWKLWSLFLGLAILGTCGPSPASIEGAIYTRLPAQQHLQGLPEITLQTLAFSVLLLKWSERPGRDWNIAMVVAISLVILMSVAGMILPWPEFVR